MGSQTDVARLVQINTGTTVQCPKYTFHLLYANVYYNSSSTFIQHFALDKSDFFFNLSVGKVLNKKLYQHFFAFPFDEE